MAREFLQGIKSENRLSKVRLIMPNDPVIGGQPSDNAEEFTSNTPFLDLACSIQYAITEVGKKANNNVSITAGNGLSGGGTLAATRTITLGTPTKITATSTNAVTTTSHTHEIDNASLTVAGVVKLNSATNSTSKTEAATPSAVKAAYDKAVNAATTVVQATGTSTTAVMSQKAVTDAMGGLLKAPRDVKNERVLETTYTNTTNGILIVTVSCAFTGGTERAPVNVKIDGVEIITGLGTRTQTFQYVITAFVPPRSKYSVHCTGANFSSWVEQSI